MPKCFISYAHEDDEHKSWVRTLATAMTNSGIEILLDTWDLQLGADMLQYMETSIRDSDFVLLICSPTFAVKANQGGVGWEKAVVTGEIYGASSNATKFVPVLRKGEAAKALPSYLRSKVYIDFRKDGDFSSSFEDLLRHLYKVPKFQRPPLGNMPTLHNDTAAPAKALPSGRKTVSASSGATGGRKRQTSTDVYARSVFLNGPYDVDYRPRLHAVVGDVF
jgi:hypothetical protein